MIVVFCVIIVCLTALVWQAKQNQHVIQVKGQAELISALSDRVSALEQQRASHYDHAAFEDLKSKVEAMRIVQGMKGMR